MFFAPAALWPLKLMYKVYKVRVTYRLQAISVYTNQKSVFVAKLMNGSSSQLWRSQCALLHKEAEDLVS